MGKAGRPRKEATKIVYIRMPENLLLRLRERADSDKRGLSDTICVFVEEKLQGNGNSHHNDVPGAEDAVLVQGHFIESKPGPYCEHGAPKGYHCYRCRGLAKA